MPCVSPLRSLAQLLDEGRTALNDPARRDRLRAEIQRVAGWRLEEMSEVEVSTWALVVLRPHPGDWQDCAECLALIKELLGESVRRRRAHKAYRKAMLGEDQIDT